MYMAMKS